MRYPGSRFNRHPALRILLGQPIQFWLQYSRTHRYTCYAIYPQVRCNSIWHSRKRLAKVSIFTPVFQLFLLIPVFHPCSKSSYSTGFSRTYAHFNSYYKFKENLFSQIRSIGKSPLSRFSLAPAATSKGGGDAIHHNSSVAFYLPSIFRFIRFIEEIIAFAIEQLYDSLQAQCFSFYFACPSVLKTSDAYMMNGCSRQELFTVSYEPFIPSCVSQQAHCLALLLSDCAHADS